MTITGSEDAALLDTYSSTFAEGTWYRLAMSLSRAHPILGGGTFYVEGFKADNSYEYQTAQIYNGEPSGIRVYRRSKALGAWNTWNAWQSA